MAEQSLVSDAANARRGGTKFTDHPMSDPADEVAREVRAQLDKPLPAHSGGTSQVDF